MLHSGDLQAGWQQRIETVITEWSSTTSLMP